MLKTKIRIFVVSVVILLSVHIFPTYASAALNVSDPSSFIKEKYDDYLYIPPVGFASKEHYFVMGAPANVKIEFFGSGVHALRLFVENSYESLMGSTNPYNRDNFKTLDLDLKPGRHKIRIIGTDVFSNVFLFYTLAINHPQPSPIIESLIPANGSIVSRIVKLGVYSNNDMAENPLISSVDVLVDNNLVETIMFPPFEYNWDTSIWPNQYHAIEYRAYDFLGRYYPLNTNV
ncbi:MAG: Ig-like domain-containing protein, partial [Actinobacteria bacterium]|nr:Ig-like domain-containing protein [Actinomycetota bacterium]